MHQKQEVSYSSILAGKLNILKKFLIFIQKNKEKIIKYLMVVASILISFLIFYFKDYLKELTTLGYLGIFLISIIGNATIVIPAPVVGAALIGGSIYNPFLVGIITALGATIGELTGYLAGEGSSVFLEENKNYKRIVKWMQKSGFLTIFILATIPNPLFDLAGIVSGATNYSTKKFLLATFLGKSLKFLTFALIGRHFL